MRNPCRLLLCVVIPALLLQGAAQAGVFEDALGQAYVGNPTLRAAQAGQRAVDEQVPQALSGWRPTISVDGQIEDIDGKTKIYNPPNRSKIEQTQGTLNITLSQPVFRGFATVKGTDVAEANVRAGQQNLLATEQNVLFSAVQAYMNVYSGRQLVSLQQENVKVLQSQLNGANERFKVGEITRTDVAQSQASLSQARASLSNARAILAADIASYAQIIGHEPGKLSYPKLRGLPASLEAAYATAEEMNPSILAAAFVEEASFHGIGLATAPLLPELSVQAQASISDDFQKETGRYSESIAVAGVLSIPLYQAGLVYSQVREAKQIASQNRIQVIEVARAVRQAVAASWNFYKASREIITAARDQVSAARLSLDGVQQEYAAGTRTTLDVLDAQAAVVTARTTLVNAQESQVLAAYQLLAAIGRLTARDLALNVPLYDVEDNYHAVRGKWIGTDADVID